MKWSLSLACSAWGVYALSFFLPAAEGMRGWECAAWCAGFMCQSYQDLFRNWKQFPLDWEEIRFDSFNFANLFVLVSPLLYWISSRNSRCLFWLRFSSVTAFVLVWSYYFQVLLQGNGGDLRSGFYLWILSFLLLFLASILRRKQNPTTGSKQLTAPSTSPGAANPAPADM